MAADQTHFIVIAVGSVGDMYPFMSLVRTLQLRGHKVTFIGPLFHIDLFQQAGIPFYGIGTREQYLAAVNEPDLWHPRKGFAVLCRDARSFLKQLRTFFTSLPNDEHCVILAHPLALPGAALSRATRPDLHIVGVYLAPAALRTCHDPLTIGPLHIPRGFPMAWRRWLWGLVDSRVIDAVALPDLNAERQSSGLPPVEHFMNHMYSAPDLSVTLFPSWFAKQQPDWPSPLHTGEFPLYEPNSNQHFPRDLTDFLAAGEPPITFTPGTAHRHAATYFANALVAVERLGRRAIFLTTHRDQVPAELPDTVLWQQYVSLAMLLPHASVLVHHGGIGTTAEALRAGVPQLVVPYAYDQFDNAARVRALGAGLSLPASGLRARNLTSTLRALLSSSTIRTQCRALSTRFSPTNNADALCVAIETALSVSSNERVKPAC